ncbi:MAG: hypothetical protein JW734_07985, partial [Candidatus Omnitrophica bacterium]|nr:hypothetical protein [Candidatus Omnitrophota bacterium]
MLKKKSAKIKFFLYLILFFSVSLFSFSWSLYSKESRYVTRVYAYEGEFEVLGQDRTVKLSSGEYLEIRQDSSSSQPRPFADSRPFSYRKSGPEIALKSQDFQYFSYHPLKEKKSAYRTRVYCFEGEPLYVSAGGRNITLKPGQGTEVIEGSSPQTPSKFNRDSQEIKLALADKQEVIQEVKKEEVFSKAEKSAKYFTRVYCFEGEPLYIWAQGKTITLNPGQRTE